MYSSVRKVIANLFALYSVQIANILIPIITFPYLVRTLGVGSFGTITYVMSWMQLGIAFVALGYNYTATLEVTQNRGQPRQLNELLISVTGLKLLGCLLFLGVLAVIAWFDPILHKHPVLILASLPLLLGDALFPAWYLLGLERMRWIAVAGIIGRVLGAVLLFALVRTEDDLALATFCQSVPMLISGIIALFWIHRNNRLQMEWSSLRSYRNRFVESAKAFGTSLPGHVYSRGQFIMLGQFVNTEDMGVYAIAQRITGIFSTLMAPIADLLFPRIGHMITETSWSSLKQLQRFTIIASLIGGLAVTLGLWGTAELIIKLITGTQDPMATHVLNLMAPIVGIIAVSVIQRPFIMAQKMYRALFIVSSLSAVLFLAVGYPMTMHLGVTGMIYTMLAVELMTSMSVVGLGLLKKPEISSEL